MIKSLKQFAHTHKIPYKITKGTEQLLFNSNCYYCNKYTNALKKTYQNVGLYNWKRGFVDNNVFPLCKLCYIIRNGMNKKQFFAAIHSILFRTPVFQTMVYKGPKLCKKYNKTKICKDSKCVYCHSRQNLSIDKINPNEKYTYGNIQTLCWTCNRMKSNLKERIFFNHIKRLFYSSLKLSMSKG